MHGRMKLGWMDDMKTALGSREMMVEAVQQCTNDGKEW